MPNLNRFHNAQQKKSDGFAQARQEISDGKKKGHWIWYILPQLNIFGNSPTSHTYGIVSFEEACDYLRDQDLFNNYLEIIMLIELQLSSKPNLRLKQLVGGDDVKVLSSLTLFRKAAAFLNAHEANPKHDFADLENHCNQVFALLAEQGYHPCKETEAYLESHDPKPSACVEPAISVPAPRRTPSIALHAPVTLFTSPPAASTVTRPVPMNTTLSSLIPILGEYINMRGTEWSFHYNFFGIVALIYLITDCISGTDHFHEKSRSIKISAATKLKQMLDPQIPVLAAPLTVAERAALNEGRLGQIVAEHGGLDQITQHALDRQSREPDVSYPFNL